MTQSHHFVIRPCCPACKSTKTETIYQRPFTYPPIKSYLTDFYGAQGRIDYEYLEKADYVLKECSGCGLIYQNDILDDFLMEKLYEHWIGPETVFESEEKTFGLDYYARYAQEIATVISYFRAVPSRLKFLDFGMGWGRWLKLVNGFGVRAFGMELSQSRIDYAKRYGIEVISWDEVEYEKFDFINTEQVFEHIPQPLETLVHLKKALKPEGLIKISVPNGAGIKTRLKHADWTTDKGSKHSLNAVSPLEHINCFNRNTIINMANAAGLVQVNIPLWTQYAFSFNNRSFRSVLKNLAKPLYNNYCNATYLFFTTKPDR